MLALEQKINSMKLYLQAHISKDTLLSQTSWLISKNILKETL